MLYQLSYRSEINLVERSRVELEQAYLSAGGLQPLELANAQPLRLHFKLWQRWRDLNPQPSDLESGALPIELHQCSKNH
jgi:hypothetical protein